MTDRQFSHPNFGKEVRLEVRGREVKLIFVAGTEEKASDLAEKILDMLKKGSLNLTMMGEPTSVEETRHEN
jgi:hypothetical protein